MQQRSYHYTVSVTSCVFAALVFRQGSVIVDFNLEPEEDSVSDQNFATEPVLLQQDLSDAVITNSDTTSALSASPMDIQLEATDEESGEEMLVSGKHACTRWSCLAFATRSTLIEAAYG